MRLLRHDDKDAWCGVDRAPEVGVGCASDTDTNGSVCGSCGLLYDAVVPQVDHVVVGGYVYSSSGVSSLRYSQSTAATANVTMPMLTGSEIDEFAAVAEITPPTPSSTSLTTSMPPATTTMTAELVHIQALVARRSEVWERPSRDLHSYDSDNIASDFIRSVSEAVPPPTYVNPLKKLAASADEVVSMLDALPEAGASKRLEMQSLSRDLSRSSRLHQEFGSLSGEPPLSCRRSEEDTEEEGYDNYSAGESAFRLVRTEAQRPTKAGPDSVGAVPPRQQQEEPQDDDDGTLASSDDASAASLLLNYPSTYAGNPARSIVAASPPPVDVEVTFHPKSAALSQPMSLYLRR